MADPDRPPASRHRGGGDLVASAHPERLRACLDPVVGLPTVQRLQACARVQDRLHALLIERYGS